MFSTLVEDFNALHYPEYPDRLASRGHETWVIWSTLQMLSSAFVWVVLVGVTFAPFLRSTSTTSSILSSILGELLLKGDPVEQSNHHEFKPTGTSCSILTLLAQVAQAGQEHPDGSLQCVASPRALSYCELYFSYSAWKCGLIIYTELTFSSVPCRRLRRRST